MANAKALTKTPEATTGTAPNDSIFSDAEKVNSYSVDDNLEYELYEVYNGTFDSSRNEVHIGTTSNFMTGVIGAEGLDLFMPAEKAYRAMKTENQAVFEGKPTGENINYHGLGVDGIIEILNASENPVAAFVDTPSVNNKRENRIVLVTDVKLDDGFGVVIEEVDSFALKDGKRIKANKSITVYPKSNISSALLEAIADNRILHLDEKRSQVLRSGVKGANYPTAISKADFTNNIRRFWENVKWKKSGRTEYTVESKEDTTPELFPAHAGVIHYRRKNDTIRHKRQGKRLLTLHFCEGRTPCQERYYRLRGCL